MMRCVQDTRIFILRRFFIVQHVLNGSQREKTCLWGFAEKHRRRPACAFAQSDQRLCYSLSGEHSSQACSMQNSNLLASL